MKEKNAGIVAYCGLCCLDCHGHTGKIADLARDLLTELRKSNYKKFAEAISHYPFGKSFGHYPQCYELLGAMVKFRCKKGCRNGGGPPSCKIRNCCRSRKIPGCWECNEPERCENLKFLEAVHGDAHIKNIRAIRKKGIDGFIAGKRGW